MVLGLEIMVSLSWWIIATISITILALVYYVRIFNYWNSIGVPQLQSTSIIYGNVDFNKSMSDLVRGYYNKFKKQGANYFGIYMLFRPTFVPIDLELIKNILVKDFEHFRDHTKGQVLEHDPLTVHIFAMEGDEWQKMRSKLTPTFTSGKMKLMFETFLDCTSEISKKFDDYINEPEGIDIKDFLGRFTTDIIGSCAFGIKCNTLQNPDSEFRYYGKKFFDENVNFNFKFLLYPILPHWLMKWFNLKYTSNRTEKFFMDTVKEIVEYREKHNIQRKDFMQLLLQLRNKGKVTASDDLDISSVDNKTYLSINEIAAQSCFFFAAGFETSSTAMTFAFYELAKHQDIQNQVREEITNVFNKYDNRFTYESINEMEYLERVLLETLRKYPPLGILPRICTKTYKIPHSNAVIEEGTNVIISNMAIHWDEEYYPEPYKFDPERFTEENKANRPATAYLPFGGGPRNCIGLRFGMLQSKVGIAALIKGYKVTLHKKSEGPLEFDNLAIFTTKKGGVWLNIEKV